MLKVGVTGGIGTGKSTVCRIFSILGIPVYDSDRQAKILMVKDKSLIGKIKKHFGNESYLEDDELNTSYLAATVFDNKEKLKQLNSLVHPAVKKDFEFWASNQDAPYSIKEAALLVETGSYKELDALIVVTAFEKLKIERVLKRDKNRNIDQVKSIINNQLSDDEKKKYADFVINNDENHPILSQVLQIHNELLQKA